MKGHLVAVASGKCLEVCERGGAVGGCDGKEGSIAQLAPCVAASTKQHWSLAEDGTLRTGLSPDLCLTSPPPPTLRETTKPALMLMTLALYASAFVTGNTGSPYGWLFGMATAISGYLSLASRCLLALRV